MKSCHLLKILLILVMACSAFAAPPKFSDRQPRPVTRVFQLKELLEHAYTDELVSFAVNFNARECREASLRLLDDTGAELPYQLSDTNYYPDGALKAAKVWFWVDSLPALGRRAYTLYASGSAKCKAPRWPANPVTWTALDAETVEVSNGVFALRLAGTADFAEPREAKEIGGPLRGFKGPDGVWRGAGYWMLESPIRHYALRVIEQGPLWTTLASRFEFVSPPGCGGGETGPFFEMHVTLYPGRDFCRVDEKSDFPLRLQPMPREAYLISSDPTDTSNWRTLPCPADNYLFNCETNWHADRMYTQAIRSEKLLDYPLLPEQTRVHTAIRATLPMMDGGWFATYSSKGADLLGVIGVDTKHWQYPDNDADPTARTPGRNADVPFISEPGTGAYFRFPISRLERHWLLVVTTKDKVVHDDAWLEAHKTDTQLKWGKWKRMDCNSCYLWQLRYKFGDLPLNKVKDWILDYDEPQSEHPNLFPEAKDRAAVLRRIADFPGLTDNFKTQSPYSPYLKYFETGKFEPPNGDFDTYNGVACVKEHLAVGYNAGMYVLSMGQYVPWMFQFADMVAPAMKPEDWKKMCRYALAGTYILMDDDYWQYAYIHGDTTYLPNFNTCRWYGVGMAGLFFPHHPDAKKWIAFSRYHLEKEFVYNISEDGVGAENVGSYYPFAWRMMTQLIRLFEQRGIADYRMNPIYHAGARCFLELLTPPDPRYAVPRRMIPPIGNHPYSAPTLGGLFEWNANTYQQVDPQLAAWSHWAWLQNNQPADYHYSMPLNDLWANKEFAAAVPPLASKRLTGFGYIFRNHFPSDKESYMAFKAGWAFYHYDQDEGSFHMFGKGVPLACDGLELVAWAPASHHNMVQIPGADSDKHDWPRGGDVVAHYESPVVDWAEGFFPKENTRRAELMVPKLSHTDWRRDIMLVKAKDPEGAEYFIVADDLNGPDDSSWHLDVHSEEPTIEPATATTPATVRYPGIRKPQFNVGLDVIFAAPANPAIVKEKGKIEPGHLYELPTIEHWMIHSPRAPKEGTLAILYPRRPDGAKPKVTPILDGKGCIVEHPDGRDIIFASPVPLTYAANGIEFTGRCAIIRDRADGSITLLDGSKLSFKGKTLTERGSLGL